MRGITEDHSSFPNGDHFAAFQSLKKWIEVNDWVNANAHLRLLTQALLTSLKYDECGLGVLMLQYSFETALTRE